MWKPGVKRSQMTDKGTQVLLWFSPPSRGVFLAHFGEAATFKQCFSLKWSRVYFYLTNLWNYPQYFVTIYKRKESEKKIYIYIGFLVGLVMKNLPANAGDTGDVGPISGSGKSPGGGNGNPLQYSSLGNPMDRRAWQVAVCRVTKSWIQHEWLSTRMYYI